MFFHIPPSNLGIGRELCCMHQIYWHRETALSWYQLSIVCIDPLSLLLFPICLSINLISVTERMNNYILSINCFSDFSNESIATPQLVKKSSVLDNQYHRKTNKKCKTHGSKCLMPTLIKEAVFTSHLCLKPMGNVIFLEETSSSQIKVTCCRIACLQEKNYNSVFSVPSEFFSCFPLLKNPKP